MSRILFFIAAVSVAAAARPHTRKSSLANITKLVAFDDSSSAAELEDTVMALVESGANTQDVKLVVNDIILIVERDMVPKVQEQRDRQQKQLDELFAAFGRCSSSLTVARDDAEKIKMQFITVSQQHQQSRKSQSNLATADVLCTTGQGAAEIEKTSRCNAVADLDKSKSSMSGLCAADNPGENYGQLATRLSGKLEEQAKSYFEKQKACVAATNVFNSKVADCTAKRKVLIEKKVEGDNLQGQMDSASCSCVTRMATTCGALDSCYDQSKTSYDSIVKTARVQEASLKTEMSLILRLQCILRVFAVDHEDGKREVAMTACAGKDYTNTIELNKLSLQIAPTPSKDSCTVPTDGAGSASYMRDQYDILPANARATSCTTSCCQEAVAAAAAAAAAARAAAAPTWAARAAAVAPLMKAKLIRGSAAMTPMGLKPVSAQRDQLWYLKKCSGSDVASCLGKPDNWQDTSPLKSGDVVAWVSDVDNRVMDCAGSPCTRQPFPPPGGHWGTPFTIVMYEGSRDAPANTPIKLGDTVYFFGMQGNSWAPTHIINCDANNCGGATSNTVAASLFRIEADSYVKAG